MDDVTRWKIIANLLISMKTLIEGALGLIQEKIKGEEVAMGQERADEVGRRLGEASRGIVRTMGTRNQYPPATSADTAKGSNDVTASEPQPQARS